MINTSAMIELLENNHMWLPGDNDCAPLFQVKRISEDPPCKCPTKFCVERLSQGRYRVGEKILFIRVKSFFPFSSSWAFFWSWIREKVRGHVAHDYSGTPSGVTKPVQSNRCDNALLKAGWTEHILIHTGVSAPMGEGCHLCFLYSFHFGRVEWNVPFQDLHIS